MAPRLPLVLVVGLLLALAAPGTALAHAYLERSSPAGNTIVETAPTRIQLWFTERPEVRFSDVTVYTADGQKISHGPLSVTPDDPRSLVFDLDPTPHGTYTVAWKTLSADDGHVAAGAFAYAVGLEQPAPTAASIFVPAGQASETGRPNVLAVVGRWLGYAGMALVGGIPFSLAFVLWPAARKAENGSRRAAGDPGPIASSRLSRLYRGGVALVVVGTLAGLLGQAVAVSGENSAALRATLLDLLGTRGGLLVAGRLVAAGVALLAARALSRQGWAERGRGWWIQICLLAAVGLLVLQALGSHAAATSIWTSFTIAADSVHLAAMTVWLGGLTLLALVVPLALGARPEHERPALLAGVVSRFSAIAVWCVGLLALTGLYQSFVHVGELGGLTRTDYGLALVAKLVLITPLLALGAFNLLVSRPGLGRVAAAHARQASRRVGSVARGLRLAVRAEVALGAAVLLATGVLANLPPAREALVQLGRAQTRSSQMGSLKARVTVDPAVAGLNTYDVALADANGKPVDDAQRVALRFSHTQMDMGEVEAVLQPRGDGHYTAQGSFLSMAGLWSVDVRVRMPGQEDVSAVVEIPAADPSTGALARTSQVPSLGTNFLLGLELLAAALVLALGARRLRLPLAPQLRTLIPRVGAVCLGVAGLYFLSTGIMNDLTPTAALANPIPPTRASLARGQEIYEQNCATCHGEYGRGDGPTGRLLRPRPADLQLHVSQHTEGQLYWWISHGFPGSAMPAWEDKLSEEDRWNALNYIVQTFRPDVPAQPAASGAGATPIQPPSPSPPLPPSSGSAPALPISSAALRAPGRGGPADGTAAQLGPDSTGRVVLTLPTTDLTIRLTITPRVLGTSEYDVALQDAAGQAFAGARRVALKLAMVGMNHGVTNQEMSPDASGVYRARDGNLFMEGPWQGWVIVELSDGSVRDARFTFETGPAQPSGAVPAVQSVSPPGTRLFSLVAYPSERWPAQVTLNPGNPVLVEAVLADGGRCGDQLRIPGLGLDAPFSPSGYARLQLQVDQPVTLSTACNPDGFDLTQ